MNRLLLIGLVLPLSAKKPDMQSDIFCLKPTIKAHKPFFGSYQFGSVAYA